MLIDGGSRIGSSCSEQLKRRAGSGKLATIHCVYVWGNWVVYFAEKLFWSFVLIVVFTFQLDSYYTNISIGGFTLSRTAHRCVPRYKHAFILSRVGFSLPTVWGGEITSNSAGKFMWLSAVVLRFKTSRQRRARCHRVALCAKKQTTGLRNATRCNIRATG